MFWNIWNLFIWREAGNKLSSCSHDSKYGVFVIGQSEQKFNIHYHFGVFYSFIEEVQWYNDSASHAIKCICEIFGNISKYLILVFNEIIIGYL